MIDEALVDKALEQISKRRANYDYFFDKLSSSDWLQPLVKRGFFREPPPVVRDESTVSFSFWPESRYLARVAAASPDLVLKTILAVPATDNVRVHEDFVDAALAMPGKHAAAIARAEIPWIETQHFLYALLPRKLGKLIGHLAEQLQVKAALELTDALLNLSETRAGHSRPAMKNWDYERILQRNVPTLVKAGGLDTLKFFIKLLDDAVSRPDSDTEEATTPPEDLSWIWRPAIENHYQNAGRDEPKDLLVGAVRDAAVALVVDKETTHQVLDMLSGPNWFLFKRIQTYVLSQRQTVAREEAERFVMNRENFDSIQLHHEYSALLKTVFPELSDKHKEQLLHWNVEAAEAGDKTPDQRDAALRNRLALLDGVLPRDWQRRLDDLVSKYGRPEHPDFHVYHSVGFVGPVSPIESADLAQRSPAQVAAFLRSWRPSAGWDAPTKEGLSGVLEADVKTRPEQYVAELSQFIGVDATYASALMNGLTEVAKQDGAIDWGTVLVFARWMAAQKIGVADSGDDDEIDDRWSWAHKTLARLLGVACEKNLLPVASADECFEVLKALSVDPNPTPEDDAKSTMDPVTRSLNTTRGEVFHSLVRFALWRHRHPAPEHQSGRLPANIRELLDRHLDPHIEPSGAVRAVYGQWLPWLALLDQEWVATSLPLLFPQETGSAHLGDAVWQSYLAYCDLYAGVFDLLEAQYAKAIKALRELEKGAVSGVGQEDRLGEHLVLLAVRGRVQWDDPSRYLVDFFSAAPTNVAANAIRFVGRTAYHDETAWPANVQARAMSLWEHAVAAAQDGTLGPAALRGFGWWYASNKFPLDWRLKNLPIALQLAKQIDVDHLVMERLTADADAEPLKCVMLLRDLLILDDGWGVAGAPDETSAVLKYCLQHPASAEATRRVIHELGARGFSQFRALLAHDDEGTGA